ncbi:hypothetical protein CK203_044098 [Vitis vinifera]|uniref:HAT C-terminal dimerisation domain-containing protein n=1 Tax=Vitis vinifera TaxID=29760 RepID=A0A438HM59_VITVI|nr:hypothetical protein CK203_044098 [Vitis vinifera]
MEPLVKVLKLVDQDKKPTLSIIYEAMDRAKLVIKASVKQWEKYWEVIDRRWEGQLHRHLHAAAYFLNPMFQYSKHFSNHPEIKVGLKEVIKRLEPDLDRQAKAINEVKLFVNGQGEFGSALTKKAINQSLPAEWWNNYGDEGPHLQKIAVKILSQLVLHQVVKEIGAHDEWIREGEEPILSSDNLDWLDKGLPTNEKVEKEMLIPVAKVRLLEQFLQVLVVMMVTIGAVGGVVALVGAIEELVALVRVLGGDGSTGGGYVSQVDPGMSWAQGGENYYATQDTDHGYRPGIWEQRKHLERLTTFPNDDDYSSGHDYHRSNHHRIDEHLQNWRDIQILEHELVTHMDMINLLVAVALLIEVLDTIKLVLIRIAFETIFS